MREKGHFLNVAFRSLPYPGDQHADSGGLQPQREDYEDEPRVGMVNKGRCAQDLLVYFHPPPSAL